MFRRTIEIKPLRLFTSYAPTDEYDIFCREHGVGPEGAVGAYIRMISQQPGMDKIRSAILLDLQEMRDSGLLGVQLSVPGRQVDFIDAWNAFLEGDDSPEVTGEVIAPCEKLIENEAVRLFVRGKTCRGPIRNHHMEAVIDMDTARRRLTIVEESLSGRLTRGTAGRDHFGHHTKHDGSGQMRVKLDGFRPSLERAQNRLNSRVWHPVDLVEIEPDNDHEPAF